MRLQFKIVGARRGPAPSPSPFASVTDWMRPSTPLKRCAFLKHNCTKTLQWVARLQPQWKDALFKLASVTDTSITIWSAPMVMSYGPNNRNFPGLDRIFPEGKIRRIRGKNPVSSPSVCPLPKSRKWRKHSETTGSDLHWCWYSVI